MKVYIIKPILILWAVIFLICLLFILSSRAQNYYNKPSKSIPAQHAWIFNKQELEKILVQHLKSLGTNVPSGKIELNGLETHYDWSNNQRLELIIREKI